MGIISNELKVILAQLEKSRVTIHGTKVDTEEDFKKEKIDMQEYARERAGMLPNPEVIVIPFVTEEE